MSGKKSEIEERLARDIRADKLPKPEREYRFAMHHVGAGPNIRARLLKAGLKDWRFDFAYPDIMLAIECEGGIFSGGRHTRGKGYEEDLKKYNAAMLLGWDVCRFSGGMVKSGNAVDFIKRVLMRRLDKSNVTWERCNGNM